MRKLELHQSKSGTVELQLAILMYGAGKNDIKYATKNSVEIVNNCPVIKEGKPLTGRSLKSLGKSLLDIKRETLQFLPPNLLAIDEETMVWWVPPSVQHVFFKSNEKGLKNANGLVMQPGLVFVKSSTNWYVYAVAGDQRPTSDTALLFSPYFNVSDGHGICTGSTLLPKNREIDAWTKAYFSSAFTHTSYHQPKSGLKFDGGRPALWRKLLSGKVQDSFPTDVLPPADITVGELIRRLQ